MTWDGQVSDYCPGDGYGGSIYFNHIMGDGATIVGPTRIRNALSCGHSQAAAGTFTAERKIDKTRTVLCASDGPVDCAFVLTTGIGAWKNNPTW